MEHKRNYNFLLALMLIVVIVQLQHVIEVEIFDKFKNIIDTLNRYRNVFVSYGNTDLKVIFPSPSEGLFLKAVYIIFLCTAAESSYSNYTSKEQNYKGHTPT